MFFIEDDDQVLAFFPESHKNSQLLPLGHLCTCYSHIGQHSACSINYVRGLKMATPKQYKDLASELESEGYDLEILTNL